jgi:hypothetical protein
VTNLALTGVFLLLLGVTSEIFNSTIDDNRKTIERWMGRLSRGPFFFLAPLHRIDAAIDSLNERGRIGELVHIVVILGLIGLVYGFLSPDFGLNGASLVLFVSMAIGIGLVTYLKYGGVRFLADHRHHLKSDVRLYGTAVGVAILCVLVTRLSGFAPGVIYGFIASTIVVAPLAFPKRHSAQLVLLPDIAMLTLGVLAWIALRALGEEANAGEEVLPAILVTVLSTVAVLGIEGAMFVMIPLRFMDGKKVMAWHRSVWVAMAGTATFLWWQLLINGDGEYVDELRRPSVLAALIILGIFIVVTFTTWAYFRWHPSEEGPEGETSEGPEAEARGEAEGGLAAEQVAPFAASAGDRAEGSI